MGEKVSIREQLVLAVLTVCDPVIVQVWYVAMKIAFVAGGCVKG